MIENLVLGNDHKESMKKINENLVQYGLTPNQSKVYLYLTKTGEKTASAISKNLNIPRTESYHLLNSLEQKGIIFSIFGKPTKFNSVSINDALTIIIDNEKKRLLDLELKKEKILTLWETVPKYVDDSENVDGNKFQILQGRNSILVKIERMVKSAKIDVMVLGSDSNFIKFYHTEFVNLLKTTKAELQVLTTYSKKGQFALDGIPLNTIKKLDENNRHNFSFIIKDENEVVFFINSGSSELMAIWTDSKSFVSTLKSLFKLIWRKSAFVLEKENKFTKNMAEDYEHRLREIEQEKVILDYLKQNLMVKKEEKND
ncbi:MAG: TrmB family transcriptional regulator [Nitrosopumilus sp.]|nr:TrmB family transcriptional regulator [Nitrosopumilus sp.]